MSGERPDNPTRQDVLQSWLEQFGLELHTALPGRVESYDPATQTANVLPLIRAQDPQPDGSIEYEDLPVIPSVPVIFPRSGKFFVSLPLAPGDTVQLLFNEAALGHWRAGSGAPEFPGDLRRHHLSHAVAIPGLYVRSRRLAGASATDLVIGNDENGATIRITPDGDILLTPAAGRDVIHAGGNTPAAKEGSGTAGHQHAPGAMTAGPWPVVGLTASATDSIATGQGSPHVKVP